MMHITVGVAHSAAAALTLAATSGAGGLETMTITSVAGSASSAAKALQRGERPDVGRQVAAPGAEGVADADPGVVEQAEMCWVPVPEAPTIPTGPGLTALANPRPTPPTMAVPQSGPITSRSFCDAHAA